MKTAVSLPDALFDEAEQAAQRLGLNRSQLYARALEAFLRAQGADPVTARLDQLTAEATGDRVAELSSRAARHLIDAGEWEW